MRNCLDNIGDNASGPSAYAVYTYLSLGTIVKIEHPAVSGPLDPIATTIKLTA